MKPDLNKSFPELEQDISSFWSEKDIFNKTLCATKGKKPFVFYEGPPTANGKPGLHHVLARSFKDIVCRYQTMRGRYVPRQAGWDTHGLPVEIQVEKELGLKSKKDIENIVPENQEASIKSFNASCRASVWRYQDLWEKLTNRMGYWLDLDNPYITYRPEYMESVWWIIKQADRKKLLYQGYKILPWCPRCGTGLSSHEVAQGYKEITDTSLFVKFKAIPSQSIGRFTLPASTYFLAWTTTPWTLPGNVALAVGPKIKYSLVKSGSAHFIIASTLLSKIFPDSVPLKEFTGSQLKNLAYQPIFPIKELASPTSHRLYTADFVSTDDGTGLVHTAVMYGEDDYQLGLKFKLPTVHTVDDTGRFTNLVANFAGQKAKHPETETKIISYLKEHHLLFKSEPHTHEYPHCWRCDSALLYYARSSWFIKTSALKAKLKSNNSRVNWLPQHLKTGRFGQWLNQVKDWAISRERYWGTPLPVWQCSSCQHQEVIGSLPDLDKKSFLNSNNNFYLFRHGEAKSNIEHRHSSWPEKFANHLTPKGTRQILASARKLKSKKIDLIVSSDIDRAKATALLLNKELGIKTPVIYDPRLREVDFGSANGQLVDNKNPHPASGEPLSSLTKRTFLALNHLNNFYQGKNILIIGHGAPLHVASLLLQGLNPDTDDHLSICDLGNAEFVKVDFKNYPRNDEGLLDLHRPFIDNFKLTCPKCHQSMNRVKELLDVWFDSGAMPFASLHYPSENKNLIDNKKMFPADYIAEAVDQTRGWFYTLLAISTILGKGPAYKNVVSLGHINDAHGRKMSKSKGNIVDPWTMFDRYGADAIRWHFFTINDVGETKNFSEKDLKQVVLNVFNILKNSYIFWLTYKSPQPKIKPRLTNPLDKWLLSRLNETVKTVTDHLNKYEIVEAANSLEPFVSDLSRWYIRRSRPRFQNPISKTDHQAASWLLHHSLLTVSRLLAPFTPFFAETLYLSLSSDWKVKAGQESVHLTAWPKAGAINRTLLKQMDLIRRFASLGLAHRAELGLKVRQPLASASFRQTEIIPLSASLTSILKDELNIKSVFFSKKLPSGQEVELDTKLTPSLIKEGQLRELIRFIQKLRAEANLKPGQMVLLYATDMDNKISALLNDFSTDIKSACSLKKIYFTSIKSPLVKQTTKLEPLGSLTLSLKK